MKNILLLSVLLFFGSAQLLNAQCYGNVMFDVSATSNGTPTFSITTAHPNELILIGYDGFNWSQVGGNGPVTVDGHAATQLAVEHSNNSGTCEVFCYSAPLAGVHNIVCTETGFAYPPYAANFAAAFYETCTLQTLKCSNLIYTMNVITPATGGSITDAITTTKPNAMIFCNSEINEGQFAAYPISWSPATFLQNTHVGDGIECSIGYESAPSPNSYSITATNTSPPNNGTGGLTEILVAIQPDTCDFSASITAFSNPTCGNNNGTATLTVVGGIQPYTYLWTPSGQTTDMATGLSIGTYTVRVTDNTGCTETCSIMLTGVTLDVADNQTNVLCFGQANGSISLAVKGGVPPYNFTWNPNVSVTNNASGLSAGTYIITVIDQNGCKKVDTLTITQPALLKVTTTATSVLCNGGNTGSATASPIGGTPPYNYSWSSGGATQTISNLTSGTYNITVTDSNGCNTTGSAFVGEPAVLTVAVTGPAVICTGESGTLVATPAGGTSPYGYGWSDGESTSSIVISPNVNTTYTVTVTDANNCQTSAVITVDLGPPLLVTVPNTQTLCFGMATTVCASATGGTGTTTYSWTPGNYAYPCITVNPSSTTIYTVTVSDACGSSTTASVQVSVNPLPNVGLTSNFFNGCYPLCVNFQDLTALSSGNLSNWTWYFGNGDTSNKENPQYCFTKPGVFSVSLTATSDSGCSSTLSVPSFITVYTHPNANFTSSPQPTTIYNPTIQFNDASQDPVGLAAWLWNFGDNSPIDSGTSNTSNLENPNHTYNDTGTYCPYLVVTDNYGCTDTISHCIVISSDYTLYIPNAFTPDAVNNLNATFAPKGAYIKNFEMYIYDRWGMQLYHTTNINNGWNGSINNNSNTCQEDTYVYVIKVTDESDNPHTYIGKVSLLK